MPNGKRIILLMTVMVVINAANLRKSAVKLPRKNFSSWCTDDIEKCECMNNGNKFEIDSGYFQGRNVGCKWVARKPVRRLNLCSRYQKVRQNCPLVCGYCNVEQSDLSSKLHAFHEPIQSKRDESSNDEELSSSNDKKLLKDKELFNNEDSSENTELSSCQDGNMTFPILDGKKMKTCNWVRRRDTWWRCHTVKAAIENCPLTCKKEGCEIFTERLSDKFMRGSIDINSSVPSQSSSSTPSQISSTAPSQVSSSTPSAMSSSPSQVSSSVPSPETSATPSQISSSVPSPETSATPSQLVSAAPSPVVSVTPSSPICNTDKFLNKTFYAPFTTYKKRSVCYRAQFFNGGKFSLDSNNPNCTISNFNETSVLSYYKNHDLKRMKFEGKGTGGSGWSGHFSLMETTNSDANFTVVKNSIKTKRFIVHVHVQSCSL